MIIIAHRGLIDGPDPATENHPDTIEYALSLGLDAEVDAWLVDGRWFLGHDRPEYLVRQSFLENPKLWVHCKNMEALVASYKMHSFWHQEDDYTLTSKGIVWVYPGKPFEPTRSIVVLPERDWDDYNAMAIDLVGQPLYGVCTDYALAVLQATR